MNSESGSNVTLAAKPISDVGRQTSEVGKKRTIHAPDGYLFVKGRGRMLVRKRSKAELYALAIRAELLRCGVRTRKVTVREYQGRFFANIFNFIRGADPEEAITVLRDRDKAGKRIFPNNCGIAFVAARLPRLITERVEPS